MLVLVILWIAGSCILVIGLGLAAGRPLPSIEEAQSDWPEPAAARETNDSLSTDWCLASQPSETLTGETAREERVAATLHS